MLFRSVGADGSQQVPDGVVGGEQETVQQVHGFRRRIARGESLPHRRGHGVAALGGQFLNGNSQGFETLYIDY